MREGTHRSPLSVGESAGFLTLSSRFLNDLLCPQVLGRVRRLAMSDKFGGGYSPLLFTLEHEQGFGQLVSDSLLGQIP